MLTESSEHRQLRATLQEYLAKNAPNDVVNQHDQEGSYPAEILAGLAELGVFGAGIPAQYGGSELDATGVAVIAEELQRAGSCIASAVTPTVTFCGPAIAWHGSSALRDRYLPGIAQGGIRLAIGLTEPDAGSDLSAVTMRADRADGGFVVSGTKMWSTGAREAEAVLALVRTDPDASGYGGLSMLLLPTSADGITIRKLPKLAWQGTASCAIFADQVWVSETELVGELHGGREIIWSLLDSERVYVAAQCVGVAQGAYDCALSYARQRHQFGRPVIKHQAVGHRLVDMASRVETSRLLAYTAVRKADKGESYSYDAALAKVTCSEAATEVVQLAMEVLGSYSYSTEYPLERFYREVKLFEIAGGTNMILRNALAKRL